MSNSRNVCKGCWWDSHYDLNADTLVEVMGVSRNWIRKNIQSHCEWIKIYQSEAKEMGYSSTIFFKRNDVVNYLLSLSNFTRQTEFVSGEELSEKQWERLGRMDVGNAKSRAKTERCSVIPFDFLDEDNFGIFRFRNSIYAHTEEFYRQMYSMGAIKVKVGSQISLFLVEKNVTGDILVSSSAFAEVKRLV